MPYNFDVVHSNTFAADLVTKLKSRNTDKTA